MATTRILQYKAITADETFAQRVEISVVNAAQAIASEAPASANHANRVALAKAVANAPRTYGPLFTEMLVAQSIDSGSTDAQIDNMVSSVWNTVAGVP